MFYKLYWFIYTRSFIVLSGKLKHNTAVFRPYSKLNVHVLQWCTETFKHILTKIKGRLLCWHSTIAALKALLCLMLHSGNVGRTGRTGKPSFITTWAVFWIRNQFVKEQNQIQTNSESLI